MESLAVTKRKHQPATTCPSSPMNPSPHPALPTEIWLQCVEALEIERDSPWRRYSNRTSDFRNLSLTSTFLCAIAQPRVFRRVRLATGGRNTREQIEELNWLFSTKPGSSSWVHSLRLEGSTTSDDAGIPKAISALTVKMDKLLIIENFQFNLTAEMYRHICYLKGPLELDCRGIRMASPDERQAIESECLPLPAVTRLDLDILDLQDGMTTAPWLVFSKFALSPQLVELELSNVAIILMGDVFKASASLTLDTLSTLRIPSPDPRNRNSFLLLISRLPNLTEVYIGYRERLDNAEVRLPYQLPSTSASSLQRFHGSLHHANLWIPGRPIDLAEIWLDRNVIQPNHYPLQSIRLGIVPITDLRLQYVVWEDTLPTRLAEMFPATKRLTLQLSWHPESVRSEAIIYYFTYSPTPPKRPYLISRGCTRSSQSFRV